MLAFANVSRLVPQLALGALLLVSLFGSAGCETIGADARCSEPGAYECRGNRAGFCSSEESVWVERNCGALSCAMVEGISTCATSPEPDPRCAGSEADAPRRFCAQGSVVTCAADGHAVESHACSSERFSNEERTPFCVEAGGEAFCATSSDPEPACADLDRTAACAGSQLLTCHLGYRTDSFRCPACIDGDDPFCAMAAEPDAACRGTLGCDGAVLIGCRDGYRIAEAVCETGVCESTDEATGCRLPLDPDCPAGDDASYCDGSSLVRCSGGSEVGRTYCAPDACVEAATTAACSR